MFDSSKAFPSSEKVQWTLCYNGHYTGCTHRLAFYAAMQAAIKKDSMNVMVYTMDSTDTKSQGIFADSFTATATYNYNAWDFDANGNIIHD